MESKTNLRPLWDAILEVYKAFATICERHGLRYCADCGTALGAVRHKGFIPWDDDMDIQMPRPDYEKFVEIAKKELPTGLAWLDRFNCPEFGFGFGKVIVTDENVVARVARESGLSLGQGVFIDVFPLDGYPDSGLSVLWRRVQNYLFSLRSIFIGGLENCHTSRACAAWCVAALISPFNYKFKNSRELNDAWEERARKCKFGSTRRCVSIGLSKYNDDKPYPVNYFGTPKEVPFETSTMKVQEHVEDYLAAMFGDYMELPPESERKSLHTKESSEKAWRLGPGLSAALRNPRHEG